MKTRQNIRLSVIAVAALVLSVTSCEKIELEKEVPDCIEKKIRDGQRKRNHSPPVAVWEWKVDGGTYYYFAMGCCDQFNLLFDENCNEVCAPDGGITGAGDGKCPDFVGTVEWTLVWEEEE